MSRKFQYVEPGYKDEPVTVTVSEEWIRQMYYPYWYRKMYKAGFRKHLSLSESITDFCVTNWATEIV